MISLHKTLITTLNDILPTYYEMTITNQVEVPCITYIELANHIVDGDTLDTVGDVAELTYQVKVWGTDIGVINEKAAAVDEALRPIGLKRISCQEMYDNNSTMIQKIMLFSIVTND